MKALKISGFAQIAAGILRLVHGSFSYTKETHEAKIGPIELSVKDKQIATCRSGPASAPS